MAQPKKRWGHFGLKTGMNISTIRLGDGVPDNTENEWKTGFVLGGFTKIPLTGKFAVQPEFFYSSMGGNVDDGLTRNKYRFNYFSIPVLARYQFSKCWAAVLGPQVDFIIQGKANKDTKITTSLNETGFGAVGGLEASLCKSIVIGGRYFYGLTNALADDATIKWYNHGAQITIGFLLQ